MRLQIDERLTAAGVARGGLVDLRVEDINTVRIIQERVRAGFLGAIPIGGDGSIFTNCVTLEMSKHAVQHGRCTYFLDQPVHLLDTP